MSPLIDSGYAWRRLLASVIISTMGGIGMWALAVTMADWKGKRPRWYLAMLCWPLIGPVTFLVVGGLSLMSLLPLRRRP